MYYATSDREVCSDCECLKALYRVSETRLASFPIESAGLGAITVAFQTLGERCVELLDALPFADFALSEAKVEFASGLLHLFHFA